MEIKGYACRVIGNQSNDSFFQGMGATKDVACASCLEGIEAYLMYYIDLGGGIFIPEKLIGDVPAELPSGHQLIVVEDMDDSLQVIRRHYLTLRPGRYVIAGFDVEVLADRPLRIIRKGPTVNQSVPTRTREYLGGAWSYITHLD